jgi:hypothetical protein
MGALAWASLLTPEVSLADSLPPAATPSIFVLTGMADDYAYRVVFKELGRRPKGSGPLREGDGVWLFDAKAPPGINLKVVQVLPPVRDGDDAEVVVELWTGEPLRLS